MPLHPGESDGDHCIDTKANQGARHGQHVPDSTVGTVRADNMTIPQGELPPPLGFKDRLMFRTDDQPGIGENAHPGIFCFSGHPLPQRFSGDSGNDRIFFSNDQALPVGTDDLLGKGALNQGFRNEFNQAMPGDATGTHLGADHRFALNQHNLNAILCQ